MATQLQIKAQIAQIRASGKVADPHTWISATSVTKNGKKYTYYRLLKGFRVKNGKDGNKPQKTKLKTKMVRYLGTADSEAYKEMQEAIARRNEIQRLERKLQSLDQEVSVALAKSRKPRQAALTKLVSELVEQVQGLVEEVAWIKRQFQQQLSTVTMLS